MLRKKINFKLGNSGGLLSGDKRLLKTSYLVPGAAIGLLGFLSIATLHPVFAPKALADEINVVAILTPSITLTMTETVSENIEPMVNGAFKNIATVARVQVNNSEYYDVSISGNPDMVGTTNPDAKISAISGSKKASEFENNTWGYNVSKNAAGVTTAVVASTDTIYKPMPSTSTQIMAKQNTVNNAADDYYSLNFGAKVDTSIPADTYTSRVTLSVVASPLQAIEYSLTYDANGGEGVPAKQTASSYEKSYEFAVVSDVPTRSGYTFLGWADSEDAMEAQYVAGSKVAVSEAIRDKTIYAVWRKTTLSDISNMQDLTTIICANSMLNETKQLADTRVNADASSTNKYWVTKLKDGNCWMTQNLDYAPTAPLPISSVGKDKNDTGKIWDNGLKVVTQFYSTANAANAKEATGNYNAHYLVGNYYQYSAAQAACPSGWSLPTANDASKSSGSYNKLADGLTPAELLAGPYYFVPAGVATPKDGAMSYIGTEGSYWSKTLDSNGSSSFSMDFNSSRLDPSVSSVHYGGISVRCYVDGN